MGLYPIGTSCTGRTGAVYSASYDSWGNLTSRTYTSKTASLAYDVLDHLTKWDWDAANADRDQEWYAYDPTGQRTLDRSVSSSGTKLTVYAFGLEEHVYNATGTNTGNTYYYSLSGRMIGKFDGTTTKFYLTDALGSVLSSFLFHIYPERKLYMQAYKATITFNNICYIIKRRCGDFYFW